MNHILALALVLAGAVTLEPKELVSIRVQTVSEAAPPGVLEATGRVQYADGAVAHVFAPVAGHVVALAKGIGDRVTKGEELFRVRSRDIATALADEVEAAHDLDLAARTLQMTREMFDQKVSSRLDLLKAENEDARANAHLARARKLLEIYGVPPGAKGPSAAELPVRTPLSGLIVERALVDGQYVTGDATSLVTVADMSVVWVTVDIFEGDLARVAPGTPATVRVPALARDVLRARVDRIVETVDPSTRAVGVRLVVPNEDGRLKPEMFVEASLEVERASGFKVPASTVFNEDGQDQVYVETGEGRFERRPVVVGAGGPGWQRVLKGLSAGDKVVTSGALLLRSAEKEQR